MLIDDEGEQTILIVLEVDEVVEVDEWNQQIFLDELDVLDSDIIDEHEIHHIEVDEDDEHEVTDEMHIIVIDMRILEIDEYE